MTIDAPLCIYRTAVKPEWLDYNGHMNEAYYVLVFSDATDAFMDYTGQDDAFRKRTGHTIYTLETHVMYLLEVGEGEVKRQIDACPRLCTCRPRIGGKRPEVNNNLWVFYLNPPNLVA